MANPRRDHGLFIDTGAFYARYVVKDQYHEEAQALWQRVQQEKLACLTSNLVLAEFITLIAYRFGSSAALASAREIYDSHAIEIHRPMLEEEMRGLDFIARFPDQKISMTDAVSFAVMEKREFAAAFTFDGHFEIAGFKRFR